jgi:UDP-glucose 4-epimerase
MRFTPTIRLFQDRRIRSFYKDRDVLVAGADGFLGFNCVRMLDELGARPRALTRSTPSRASSFAHDTVCGDLSDRNFVERAANGQEIIFDFAGSIGAVDSNKHPQRSLDEECRAHLNLFETASANQARLVFCSSRLVYGRPRYLPIDESHPLCPQSFYATHKLTVEFYLQVLAQERGLRYSIVRLSNPYGPFQNLNRSYGVINQFIRAASAGEPLFVYGNGRQYRDYIYVEDAISAFLQVAANGRCDASIFNLGGMQKLSVADAALRIAMLAGGCEVKFVPWPAGSQRVETGDYYSNTEKLRRHINLSDMTSFDEGILRSLDYYRGIGQTAALQTEDKRIEEDPIQEQIWQK